MRLQVCSERLYSKRVATAINRATVLEIDLVDASGRVMRSYKQTVSYEPNLYAYYDAANPPVDDCMERKPQQMRLRFQRRRAKPVENHRRRLRRPRGGGRPTWSHKAIPLDYSSGPARPPGTVVMF